MSSPGGEAGNGRWATVDRVLRGHFLQPEALASGRIDVPVRLLVRMGVGFGAVYGACLGTYGLFQGGELAMLQVLSAAVKVPLLFLLTLIVTFPSLYVFSALQRSPLGAGATLRLLLLVLIVDVTVLASLGPVFAFFAASTESYAFMTLLNVTVFVIGGVLGLVVLRKATNHLFERPKPPAAETEEPPGPRSRASRSPDPARRLLGVWCLVYGVVGAQMGWLLRPFLGAPGMPFQLFRQRQSSVFEAILMAIRDLFSG